MTMTVNGPGGVTVRFPDGTDAATIDRVMRQATSSAPAPDNSGKGDFAGLAPGVTSANPPGSAPGQYNAVESALIGAGDMATFGTLDELGAGVKSLISGTKYDDELAKIRGRRDEAQAEHPIAFTAGQIAGAAPAVIGVPEAALARGAGIGARMAAGAATGAASGGLYGFGSGEGGPANRLENAGIGAATGGILGALLPAAGGVVGKIVGKRAAAAAPTVAELKAQSQALYDTANSSGVRVKPQAFSDAVDNIARDAQAKGIDPDIHPKATAALGRLVSEKGTAPDIQQLDTLRQVVRSAATSTDPAERYQAGRMLGALDRFVGSLKPGDVTGGDPNQAFRMIADARRLWVAKSKGDVLADMFDRAQTRSGQYSGSGFENALRTEFRQLALNAKRMRQFTPNEQAQIKAIARGGTMQNLLRAAGKLAPTGAVSGAVSVGGGFAAGGPVGAAALPAAGWLARKAATRIGLNKVRALDEMVRNGGIRPFNVPAAQAAQVATTRALLPFAQGIVPFMLQPPVPDRRSR